MLKDISTKLTQTCIFFVLLFGFLKLLGPIPLSINSVSTSKNDSFTVSGEGSVNAAPDIANISVGVQATGSTVKDAQTQINANINKISSAIKSLGINESDLQTMNYSIYPTNNLNQQISGYQSYTSLSIKIHDLNLINKVIDTATANGATNISGVNFDIDDKTKLENQAREKAVAQAKQKANDQARIAGFRLGRIINYSEDNSGVRSPIMLNAAMANSVNTKTQVEPGSNEIKVTVNLSYEII